MKSHLRGTALFATVVILAGAICTGVFAESIGDLSLDRAGEEVTIEGAITRLLPSSYERQPNRLTVTDPSGAVTVVIWPDVFGAISPAPAQGLAIRVTGEIGEYRGELQVQVEEADDVAVLGEAAAPAPASAPASQPAAASEVEITPLSAVTADRDGAAVVVEGTITNFRASWSDTAPNIITINDGTGEAPVVIWPDDFNRVNPQPESGNRIRVTGEITVYRGTAQIRCEDPAGIVIVSDTGAVLSEAPMAAPAESATAQSAAPAMASGAPTEIAVSDIDGSTVGQTVLINGTIAGVRPAWNDRAPNTITLTDGTSTIPVVAWSDTWDSLDHEPAQGDRVRITGEVSLYEARNELQVRLRSLEYTE